MRAFFRHTLRPAGLGTRQASLQQKLHGIVHSLRLETQSWESTSKLARCFLGLCSDQGTEQGLNTIDDVCIKDAFWYWHPDADMLMDDSADMSASAGVAERAAGESPVISLAGSFFVPGTFHVVDGLSKAGVGSVCSM